MTLPDSQGKGRQAEASARRSEVIYQIYPASFCDSNGDGHGDLQGIISKLDHLAYLGVDALWLSPVYPSPEGPEGDGGYAVTNRRDIDPRYGCLDDMKQLIAQAHKRGLKVYMDDVTPHTSDDHEWFQASRERRAPFDDFYVWHDGVADHDGNRQPPNNWLSVFGGGAWEWDDTRRQYYFHHFLTSQPALNLNSEKVQDAVLDDMKFWLDMGVDGFRLDSICYAHYDPHFRDNDGGGAWDQQYFSRSHCQPQTVDFVSRIRQLTDSYSPPRTTLGEVICGRDGGRNPMEVAADYVDPESGLTMCYTDVFRAISHQAGPSYMKDAINGIIRHFPHGQHCNAIGNHDSPRIASREIDHIPELARRTALKQLLKILTVLPGSLSIYQGEELGLPDARVPDDIPHDKVRDPVAATKGYEHCRDGARTPVPWDSARKNAGFSNSDTPYLPVPDDHYHRAVNKQMQDPGSMLHFMKHLITWRKSQPALQNGAARVLETLPPLVAIVRECDSQTMLCVFNVSDAPVFFKPSDLLDDKTLAATGIAEDEVIRCEPYGAEIRGAETAQPACGKTAQPCRRRASVSGMRAG